MSDDCKCDDSNTGCILLLLLLGFLFRFPTCNYRKEPDKPAQVEKTEEVAK